MDFLNRLLNYEKDQITEEIIELIQPYLLQEDWFKFENAKNASVAAAGIFNWAVAIHEYHNKSKIVKPKRAQLKRKEG